MNKEHRSPGQSHFFCYD